MIRYELDTGCMNDSQRYLISIHIPRFTFTLCSYVVLLPSGIHKLRSLGVCSGSYVDFSQTILLFHDISNFTFNLLQKLSFAIHFLGTKDMNKVSYITSVVH